MATEKPTNESASNDERPKPQCLLAVPFSREYSAVREAIRSAVMEAGFLPVSLDEVFGPQPVSEILAGEMARSDCVVADLTDRNPNVFFEVGLAQAMGKALFLLVQQKMLRAVPFDLRGYQFLVYEPTAGGLLELALRLRQSLEQYGRFPRARRGFAASSLDRPFFVDWERLDASDIENLISELLTQMGFQRVDWGKDIREVDIIAELPRKDPDGFEYRELWLVSLDRNVPNEDPFYLAIRDPEAFLHRLARRTGLERIFYRSPGAPPLTLLVIVLGAEDRVSELEELSSRARRGPGPSPIRVRFWDRSYLTLLIQQFPQIGYKYFSDEGRALAKFRKSPEELYRENVDLANRLAAA
jgi:hypothetical protein